MLFTFNFKVCVNIILCIFLIKLAIGIHFVSSFITARASAAKRSGAASAANANWAAFMFSMTLLQDDQIIAPVWNKETTVIVVQATYLGKV